MSNFQREHPGAGDSASSPSAAPRPLWRRLHATPAAALVALGLVTLVVGGAAAIARYSAQAAAERRATMTIEAALEALDAGEPTEARRIAAWLRTHGRVPFEEAGGPLFVLGVVMAEDARRQWHGNERQQLALIAAQYLEQAAFFGFPPGREADGWMLLGGSYFESRRFADSRQALERAAEAYAEPPAELERMLALAHLYDTPSRPAAALVHIEAYLARDDVSDSRRQRAELERAEILLEQGALEAGLELLESIPDDAPLVGDRLVLQGRFALRQADRLRESQPVDESADELAGESVDESGRQAVRDAYEAAIGWWERALEVNGGESPAARRAEYLIGVALRRAGDELAAERQFARARRLNFNTPEGVAAGIEEAEVQLALGRSDVALAAYRRLLQEVGDPNGYDNRWIGAEELGRRLEAACANFLRDQQFAHARDLARALAGFVGQGRSLELQAEVHRAWAEQLGELAESALPTQAAELRVEASQHWRSAGVQYDRVARMEVATRRYPDLVWESAECFLRGGDFQRGVSQLRAYLRVEPRRRRARALVAMGEAQLALGNVQQALVPLMECLELHHRDPDSYRARLLAAQAYVDGNDLVRARALLQDNLHNELLTPRSQEWRDSLFLLGRVAYRQGCESEARARLDGVDSEQPEVRRAALAELERAHEAFQESVVTLDRALRRYPADPQGIEARYLIARSHHQMAKLPQKMLPTVNIETTRNALVRQMHEHLESAVGEYRELRRVLNDHQAQWELSPTDRAVLRNCYFAEADVLFDLGRYEEAIRAYSSATNRYQDEPLALEAYVQIAECQRRLERYREARGTLEQAKVVLGRIRDDVEFTRTTRYDRAQWAEMLDWLGSL